MEYMQTYKAWLDSSALNGGEREELRAIAGDPKEIESRFFSQLEFGTAGLRGIMGTGLFRMNRHVVRHATQAFAEVILDDCKNAEGASDASVAVCFDCRNNSREFARDAACVMAASGIRVRIFDALRPTPELSFAIREYGLTAGLNITASHNPKEYNGYKVYWGDGAQLPPHHAAAIAAKMRTLDVFSSVRMMDYDTAVADGLITVMGEETDALFMKNVMAQVNDYEAVKKVAGSFKMVYTPFHGTGYRLVPEALGRLGIKNLFCVAEQMMLDGNFPTVTSPNPENPEGFQLAVQLAKENGADFILGTDPDADRVGIMVRDQHNEFVTISGNQTGVLLLDYLIGAKKRAGTLPDNPVVLKTIVTTEMARRVSEYNGVRCIDTFTGFKFMAERKNELEDSGTGKVIFSYEESYGYMIGDFVRDKDAVTASLLLTEMAAWYAGKNMTLYDALQALYPKYGFYNEKTLNLMMPGMEGLADMKKLMANLREKPPLTIAGNAVRVIKDYEDGTALDVAAGTKKQMELIGSNVLRFETEDKTVLIVRPSGTEPKVKVYILANGTSREECDGKIKKYSQWAEMLRN